MLFLLRKLREEMSSGKFYDLFRNPGCVYLHILTLIVKINAEFIVSNWNETFYCVSNSVSCVFWKRVVANVLCQLSSTEMSTFLLIGYFYRRQRSWGKVMFSQACVILFTGGGGCLPQCMLGCHTHPRKQTPPPGSRHPPLEADPPPRSKHRPPPGSRHPSPWRRHPLGADTPPLPEQTHTPGRRHPPWS